MILEFLKIEAFNLLDLKIGIRCVSLLLPAAAINVVADRAGAGAE